MDFDDDARLDTSQIRDRRGGGVGRTAAIGGGGLGVAGLIIVLLLNVLGGGGSGGGDLVGQLFPGGQPVQVGGGDADNSELEQNCRTGADADRSRECRIVAVVNSTQSFWADEFARRGARYEQAPTTFFSSLVDTGCGRAGADVGPFYCPPDAAVYIDLGFFDELQSSFGAAGGDFAESYVIAHEYGHHVQHLTGQADQVRTREGPASDAVRLELQADCYAGIWAHHATAAATPGSDGDPLVRELTDDDIARALDAAATVGDDYIQRRSGGSVDPESWTHGSSAQRERWFSTGYRSGNLDDCDTFAAPTL